MTEFGGIPAGGPRGHVLVVDDDEIVREVLTTFLVEAGHQVHSAPDATEALWELSTHTYDVVLLDFQMPGVNGIDLLKKIRARWSMSELPVIMATARDEVGDITQALRLGANDYMTKPLQADVLQARVEVQIALKCEVAQRRGSSAQAPDGDVDD